MLDDSPHLNVVQPKGAFYLAVTFSPDFIQRGIAKPAANPEAQKLLDAILKDIPEESFDKRFCHKLLATTGICTVPLSTGFNSKVQGFRMTLLEADDAAFTKTLEAIKDFWCLKLV